MINVTYAGYDVLVGLKEEHRGAEWGWRDEDGWGATRDNRTTLQIGIYVHR